MTGKLFNIQKFSIKRPRHPNYGFRDRPLPMQMVLNAGIAELQRCHRGRHEDGPTPAGIRTEEVLREVRKDKPSP
ncbi:MAG: hypothetical protein ACLS3C_03890 [Oscillospiraceae bacterium]